MSVTPASPSPVVPPFLPFAQPEFDESTISGVADVLRSRWVASGPWVQRFEADLSAFHGGRTARVMNSATAALEVALRIAGIGPGDEVITSAMSFFASVNMIERVGATPVFVDCELSTRNIDLDQAERAITPRTRAILPTHFAGLPCDMDRLYDLARRHQLRVIEDAALAIGSSWRGRRIGSFGDLVCFSFHPNKNMTSIEGGALIVNDEAEARLAERWRFHGIQRLPDGTRDVAEAGGKFNLPDVNARVGVDQLARLEAFNARRRELVDRYFARWQARPEAQLPHRGHAGDETGHSWNMFAPLLPLDALTISRQQFMAAMHERGIGTGISYEPLHLTRLARARWDGREGRFPNAERIGRETVTLPLFTAMRADDVDRVCDAVADVFAGARR
ncbi:MAG: DegT/DnrJ/EryC1/StrS aminotransferase family protein [Burkholderiaceae bacterium]